MQTYVLKLLLARSPPILYKTRSYLLHRFFDSDEERHRPAAPQRQFALALLVGRGGQRAALGGLEHGRPEARGRPARPRRGPQEAPLGGGGGGVAALRGGGALGGAGGLEKYESHSRTQFATKKPNFGDSGMLKGP